MPDPTNPIGVIGSALGGAAASVVGDALDAAGEKVWNVAASLLTGAFSTIDTYSSPNVDPRTGPLAGVLPTTLWVGGAVLLVLSFLQIGKAVVSGGRGFATLAVGLGQYVLISAGGLTFLAVAVAASNGLASGLLQAGLHVDSWNAINDRNSVWVNAAHGAGGSAMGLIGLICVLPAALGFLLEALIRHAAILVLAATMPILAAGLVFDATTRWFWTGLRWMVALLLLTPAVALVTVIGMQAAAGAAGAGGQSSDLASSTLSMTVGGVVLLVALLCPLVLFKLLAFLDPNTVSGGAVRGFFTGSPSSAGAPATGASASGGSGDGEGATESRFGSALARVTGPAGQVADAASERGGQILDAAGAGHQGSPHASQNGSSAKHRAGSADPTTDGDNPTSPTTSPGPSVPQPVEPPSQTPAGAGGAGRPEGPAFDPAVSIPAGAGAAGSSAAAVEEAAVIAL